MATDNTRIDLKSFLVRHNGCGLPAECMVDLVLDEMDTDEMAYALAAAAAEAEDTFARYMKDLGYEEDSA